MSTAQLLIDLDTLGRNRVLPPEQLIFRTQFDELCRTIRSAAKENIELLKNQGGDDTGKAEDGTYELSRCFFIDGARGSGKSTLLRAVRYALLHGEEPGIRIASLADVDPTELGKVENFFLYLMGRIYHLLDDVYHHQVRQQQVVDLLRGAMETLRKLSSGLCMLLNSDKLFAAGGEDEYQLEEAVEKCADSAQLRRTLNVLLEQVCRIVNADILLVTIDDADLDFRKCEEVLEYVRKYLRSPRLLFLFAGDMKQYSHVVRGMYVHSFAEGLWKHDVSHETSRRQLLDRLEDQYLVKLFPSVNRVNLGGFADVLEPERQAQIGYRTSHPKPEEKRDPIQVFLNHFFDLIAEDAHGRHALYSLFRHLPIRSVFSLLQYWNAGVRSEEGTFSPEEHRAAVRRMFEGARMISVQTLVKYNIDYEALQQDELMDVLRLVFRHMAGLVSPEKGNLSMLANAESAEQALAILSLSMAVQQACSNVESSYIYLCSMFPNWYQLGRRLVDYVYEAKSDSAVRTMAQEQWIDGNGRGSFSQWGAQACACMAPRVRNQTIAPRFFGNGTIKLMKKPREWDMEQGYVKREAFTTVLHELTRKEHYQDPQRSLFCLAFYHSLCRLEGGRSASYYLSLYNLVCFAAELLRVGREHHGDAEGTRQEVKRRLGSMSYVPNARAVDSDSKSTTDQEDELLGHLFVPGVDLQEVQDAICEWVITYSAAAPICVIPAAYQRCWDAFMAGCDRESQAVTLNAVKSEQYPRALSLLQKYMAAFEAALKQINISQTYTEIPFAESLIQFPLWKALMEAESQTPDFFELVNSMNIGTLTDRRLVQAYNDIHQHLVDCQKMSVECREKHERCSERIKAAHEAAQAADNNEKKARKEAEKLTANSQKAKLEWERLQNVERTLSEELRALRREIGESGQSEANLHSKSVNLQMQFQEKQEQERELKEKLKALEKDEKERTERMQTLGAEKAFSQEEVSEKDWGKFIFAQFRAQQSAEERENVAKTLESLRPAIRHLGEEKEMTDRKLRATVRDRSKLETHLSMKESEYSDLLDRKASLKAELSVLSDALAEAHQRALLVRGELNAAAKELQEAQTAEKRAVKELRSAQSRLAAARRKWEKAKENDESLINSILS